MMEPSRDSHVGDLARRVSHRRTELGLSTEELAKRAGVDAWFLAYFEQSSDTARSPRERCVGWPSPSKPHPSLSRAVRSIVRRALAAPDPIRFSRALPPANARSTSPPAASGASSFPPDLARWPSR